MDYSGKIDGKNIEDIFALTPVQEGMLFHYLKEPASQYYFEQLSLMISSKIDMFYFQQAWKRVIRSHGMMRTVFRWESVDKPVQIVLKKARFIPEYYDFSSGSDVERPAWLEELKKRDRQRGFDLRQVPFRVSLCKMSDRKYILIISHHHILYDGWSSGIVLKAFLSGYDAMAHGGNPGKEAVSGYRFKEFVQWLQRRDVEEEENYWKEYFREFDKSIAFPSPRKETGTAGPDLPENFSVTLDNELTERLTRLVEILKITMAGLFYCAWGILLQKYSYSRDVVFGTTVAGRPEALGGIESAVGLFINTVPLRVRSCDGETVSHMLDGLKYSLKIRKDHENVSLPMLKGWLRESGRFNESLFDSIVVFDNYPLDNALTGRGSSALPVDSYSMFETTHYGLTVGITAIEKITVDFSYQVLLLTDVGIQRLSAHLVSLLKGMVEYPQRSPAELDILSKEERCRLLHEFNDTGAEYPLHKSLTLLIDEQVGRTPDQVALMGMENIGGDEVSITYDRMKEETDCWVTRLHEMGIGPGTIVAVNLRRTVEMAVALTAILKAGGAYLPIEPDFPVERVRYILKDSQAEFLLTTTELGIYRYSCSGVVPIFIEAISRRSLNSRISPKSFPAPETGLVYVLYTSGSSGRPKGVAVEQGGEVNLLVWFARRYHVQKGMHVLLMSSYSFDPSVEDIFGSLVSGAAVYIGEKDLACDKEVFRSYVSRHCIQLINFVPAFLRELLAGEEKLPSLQTVISGGERLDETVKDAILDQGYRLYNHYGPTEATVDALTAECGTGKVTIGYPVDNACCFVLDRDERLTPEGIGGELCIGGAGVARGYLNRPELTAEKFSGYRLSPDSIDIGGITDSRSHPSQNGRLYRSGDLCRRLADGRFEYLGRLDRQVKIRGHRVELAEIEAEMSMIGSVKEAVVIDRQTRSGETYLCAYFVIKGNEEGRADSTGIRRFLNSRLPAYMVPSYFVRLDNLPFTPGGKPDRQALPEPEITDIHAFTAPADELEKVLAVIWARVLFEDGVEPTLADKQRMIGSRDNFFELGGHSLKATMLVSRIHKELGIKIPLAEIFRNPTLHGQAGYVKSANPESYIPLQPVEKREYYPLSTVQIGLYTEQYRGISFTGYNSRATVKLEGQLDISRLKRAFRLLMKRHEILRTSIRVINDQPVQRVHEEVDFDLEFPTGDREVTIDDLDHLVRVFIRPFQLDQAPLFRVGLIKLGEADHILVSDMHHIISDAPSTAIFEREFMQLYRTGGEDLLPALKIQYKDFSLWQSRTRLAANVERQRRFWLKEYKGEIPLLNLPVDKRRSGRPTFAADIVQFELPEAERDGLRELAGKENGSLFMVLMALFNVMLARWCDQEDIVVGSPVVNRHHEDLEGIIGYFVNMLALRNYPGSNKEFRLFLREVAARTLQAYENREFQYDELVTALSTARNSVRNSLFDVVLAFQNQEIPPRFLKEMTELKVTPYRHRAVESPFDLGLFAAESGRRLEMLFFYKTGLFRRETIEGLVINFKEVVAAVMADENVKIKNIDISNLRMTASAHEFQAEHGDFGFREF